LSLITSLAKWSSAPLRAAMFFRARAYESPIPGFRRRFIPMVFPPIDEIACRHGRE
jgi:hypothetical protein